MQQASSWQGVALRTVVKALVKAKKVKEARKLVNRRMDIFKEQQDQIGISASYDAMADVVMAESGDAEEASSCLQQAIEAARSCQMKERQFKKLEATLVAEQANFCLQASMHERALELAKASCEMFEKLDCRAEMATTMATMVLAKLSLQDLETALDLTRRCIEIYQELGDRKAEGLAWINHCSALTKLGNTQEAYEVAMKARDIFASQKLVIGEGQALDHLSSLCMMKGDFGKAATFAKRGKALFKEAACQRQEAFMAWAEAEAFFGQAQTLAEFKDGGAPPEAYTKALDAGEEALQLSRGCSDELLVMHSLQVVAKTLIMCCEQNAAMENLEEALQLAEKLKCRVEEGSLRLLQAQCQICCRLDNEAIESAKLARALFAEQGNEVGLEQADEIISGDFMKQREDEGITTATPMAAMPSMPTGPMGASPAMGRTGPAGPGPMMPQTNQAPAAAPAAPAASAPIGKESPPLEQIVEQVADIAISLTGEDDLTSDTPLMDAGLDSLASVEFQNLLQKEFKGVAMPSTMMFDFPTAKEIAQHIKDSFRG